MLFQRLTLQHEELGDRERILLVDFRFSELELHEVRDYPQRLALAPCASRSLESQSWDA